MANENTAPGTVVTKKRIRLSRVLDKLAVLGNGMVLADRENNNVTMSEASLTTQYSVPMAHNVLQMTPQLAATVPQTYPVIQQTASITPRAYPYVPRSTSAEKKAVPQVAATVPEVVSVLPDSGSAMMRSYMMYRGLSALHTPFITLPTQPHTLYLRDYPSAPQATLTTTSSAPSTKDTSPGSSNGSTRKRTYNAFQQQNALKENTTENLQNLNTIKIEADTSAVKNEPEQTWEEPKEPRNNYNFDQYQQAPLDLSVRGIATRKDSKGKGKALKKSKDNKNNENNGPQPSTSRGRQPRANVGRSAAIMEAAYPVVRGDVASPTTAQSVAERYNLQVSPVVEQMPAGSDTAWACPVCGQLFSQRDRLAKHVASRHRGRSPSRSHVCWKCHRGFSRSDMLTRHLRLHTGQKPYRCTTCGQIFSRSDHLATHRRTHTGEKPYKCPQCPYAACRRDMITRHMRTHRHHGPVCTSPSASPNSSVSRSPRSRLSSHSLPSPKPSRSAASPYSEHSPTSPQPSCSNSSPYRSHSNSPEPPNSPNIDH